MSESKRVYPKRISSQIIQDTNELLSEGLEDRSLLTKTEKNELLLGFWLLGLCNNTGYTVALTAAHDLIGYYYKESNEEIKRTFQRDCNIISTSLVLLGYTLPTLLVKLLAPFFSLRIHIRMLIVVLLVLIGTGLIGYGFQKPFDSIPVIAGIILVSLSSGLGESSLLGYSPFFSTINVISAFSSGTGASGVIGSTLYAILRETEISKNGIGVYIMLICPVIMSLAFWTLIPHPKINKFRTRLNILEPCTETEMHDKIPTVDDPHTCVGKLKILKKIFIIYTVPFFLTLLFGYYINQGLFELLIFPRNIVAEDAQYRWYQISYEFGSFIARSSMNFVEVHNIWMLAFLQSLNVFILISEVLLGFLYFLVVCIVYVLWNGILDGASYVNTYRRIATEIPPLQRQFAMSMNSFGDAVSMIFAGVIAIPVHRVLCRTNNPYTWRLNNVFLSDIH